MSRIQDKNVVVILNKYDLEKKIDESDIKKYIDADIIQLSAPVSYTHLDVYKRQILYIEIL